MTAEAIEVRNNTECDVTYAHSYADDDVTYAHSYADDDVTYAHSYADDDDVASIRSR